MLADYYRFWAVNNSGQIMDFAAAETLSITLKPWKFDSNGALTYGSEATDDFGFGGTDTIADGAWTDGTNGVVTADQANGTNKYIGLHGTIKAKVASTVAAVASVDFYLETSTDGGVTWPSEADDFDCEADLTFIQSIQVSAASDENSVNFSL